MDYSWEGRPKFIKHLEELHGKDAVCHIGTYTCMGVKSGLKDFARVLEVPFSEANALCKAIDEITDETPGIKFKDIDNYYTEAMEVKTINPQLYNTLIAKYNKFKELENKYPEIFRLARKFEGTERSLGIHASGILVTPCNVTDYFPIRVDPKTGVTVALYTGPQLEEFNAIKLDY